MCGLIVNFGLNYQLCFRILQYFIFSKTLKPQLQGTKLNYNYEVPIAFQNFYAGFDSRLS